jgi:uncharacterized membrane protein YidH (DUF202 family)
VASSNPLDSAQEAQQMLVAYAKQETLEPLKDLKRYLALGLGGAVSIFLGVMFLGLGLLRGLQELDAFDGGFMTVIPYLITVVALAVVMVLIFLLYGRAKKRVLR